MDSAKRLAGKIKVIFGHPSYPYKSSEQLFRSLRFAAFPKPTFGFRFGKVTMCNERNNCQLLLKGADFCYILFYHLALKRGYIYVIAKNTNNWCG